MYIVLMYNLILSYRGDLLVKCVLVFFYVYLCVFKKNHKDFLFSFIFPFLFQRFC